MMLKSILLAAGLAVAALSAQAATMKAVWTGTIIDQPGRISVAKGMFGYQEETLLAGKEFRAEVIFDTLRGTRSTTAALDDAFGTTGADDSQRVIRSAKIIINKNVFLFPVTDNLRNRALINQTGSQEVLFSQQVLGNVATGDFRNLNLQAVFASDAPIDLEAPVSETGPSRLSGQFRIGISQTEYFFGTLSTETLTIAPIPLPATLPLALAALAGLGIVARRRAGREAKGA
jgi:hypothetical protein